MAEYSVTWRHTSVVEDMMVSYKEHGNREFKVAPRIMIIRP